MSVKRYVNQITFGTIIHKDPEAYVRRQLRDAIDLGKRMKRHAAFLEKALKEIQSRKKRSKRAK